MEIQNNAISPMWKKYQNVLSNNNDAPLVSQSMGLWPHAQIVAVCAHCAKCAPISWPEQHQCNKHCPTMATQLTSKVL